MYGKTCTKCQDHNHFARCCKSKNVNTVQEDLQADPDVMTNSVYNVGSVIYGWIQPVLVNGSIIQCKLDTEAQGKTCTKCQGRNHFARCCKSKNVNTVQEDLQADPDVMIKSAYNVGSVTSDWIQPVLVNGSIIPCKLDTGAQVTG